ncbi:flagellar basal body-associated FliL family protein [Lysobacter sp. D1-1-M9]|uniref:flagellar basal body-associated FliL family protein n=1 Tax=Novilysobacter longmucuonensis TaxID=3098603 RepID=UPI002FCB2EB8
MSAEPTSKPKRRGRGLIWTIVAVVVLGAAAGGWWWWQAQAAQAAEEGAADAEAKPPAIYFALEPAFVVNLADPGPVRYLQADVQLMTRDPATAAALELHAPALRNHLLLLFGQQTAAQLGQRSAKERLQAQAVAEVRKVLENETAPDQVEAVFFTSLVTQ